MANEKIKLTSAEIASIWTGYMNDSLSKCILGYFLQHVEDKEIRSVFNLLMTYHLPILKS